MRWDVSVDVVGAPAESSSQGLSLEAASLPSFHCLSMAAPRTNVLDTKDRAYLKSCRFGPKDPYCPIFRLGSVVRWTGSDFQEIALQVGGVPSGSLPWGLRALNEEGCVGEPMGWGGPAKSPAPGTSCFQNSL